ncbi:MAG: hypothetical protein AAGE59_03070 [Cyanobacteria bacterium P01_F01_bin.86]
MPNPHKLAMTFDIYSLQNIEDDDWTEVLNTYTDTLIDRFAESPEGKAHFEKYQHIGWSVRLIDFGFSYQEVTLPEMDDHDIESILFEIFPRKVSLMSPDDADDVIPELIAFWQYLHREYDLGNAEDVLAFLQKMDPEKFKAEMNNPDNFGMARSFLQSGLNAGFDMTTNEGVQAFQQVYNAQLAPERSLSLPSLEFSEPPPMESAWRSATKPKKSKSKQKRRQAIAKASRKQNRKKKK